LDCLELLFLFLVKRRRTLDLSYPISQDVHIAFSTPYLISRIPDFEKVNSGLIKQVLAARDRDVGENVSNIGGWHSSPTLWDWKTEEIATFRKWVHICLLKMGALSTKETDLKKVEVEYAAAAWANVNTNGHYNEAHIHPECDWSCVYYASSGHPDPGWNRNGLFELRDPRSLAYSSKLQNYGFGRSLVIDPEPGKIILFPAWMEHLVHPFYGKGERISIAVNIKNTGGRHSGL
tara:strand:+ start:1906 stop:2607 length:702 start_codon:yes stop_codon:yes gene_type:complete